MIEQNGVKTVVDIADVFRDNVTESFTKQQIISAEDAPYLMPQLATDIEFQIEKMEPSKSGLVP